MTPIVRALLIANVAAFLLQYTLAGLENAFGFVPAPPRARAVLGTEEVLEVRRCNLADGEPFARVTVWCPPDLARSISRDDVERSPFYELLTVPLGGAVVLQVLGDQPECPLRGGADAVVAGAAGQPGRLPGLLLRLERSGQVALERALGQLRGVAHGRFGF